MKTWPLLLLLLPLQVFAFESKTFSWIPPVAFTDGKPLNADIDLSRYRLHCDSAGIHIDIPNSPGLITWTSPDGTFSQGTYSCNLTAISSDGIESGPSNTTTFTIDASTPEAPSNFQITITINVNTP